MVKKKKKSDISSNSGSGKPKKKVNIQFDEANLNSHKTPVIITFIILYFFSDLNQKKVLHHELKEIGL